MDDTIKSLPKSMYERALWAREAFILDPEKSAIDDDCLVWMRNEEDNLWYSILGNYSYSSPEEKRLKEWESKKNRQEYEEQKIETAKEYYERVLYYSEIRTRVLERDNYTCQMCGKKGNGKLHIHHILKQKQGRNDCLDNLITCCPCCHKKADGKDYNPRWIK